MLSMMNKKLSKLLTAKTHSEVLDLMLQYVPADFYDIYTKDMFTLVTPRNKVHKYLPLICVHTDTVRRTPDSPILQYYPDFNIVKATNGVLGADDRAGCYIVSELMEREVELAFLICDEEEVGGIGSREAIEDDVVFAYIYDNVSAFVGLDRKGHNQVALYGYESTEFEQEVLEDFFSKGYVEAMGTFTDASNLAGDTGICCCNLSIGYYNEHTGNEYLDITQMENCFLNVYYNLPKELFNKQYIADNRMYGEYSYYDDYDVSSFASYYGEGTYSNPFKSTKKSSILQADTDYTFSQYCKDFELDIESEQSYIDYLNFMECIYDDIERVEEEY